MDVAGLVLVAMLAVWVAFFAGGGHGRAGPVLWLLAGLVAAFAVGRALSVRPGLVPRLVAVGVAGSFAFTWPGVLSAGGDPTGYANTNCTLAALGVIAALAAARRASTEADRRGWLVLSGFLFVCALLTESSAGVLSLALAVGLLLVAALTRWPPFAFCGSLIVLSMLLGVTGIVASGDDILGLSDHVRTDLWQTAVDLMRDEPVDGVGVGLFSERSSVSDDDLRWAHHEYLQVAAEQGLVGLTLVLLLIAWLSVRLTAAAAQSAEPVIIGGAALLVVFHAAVDYVWHMPAVPLSAAILIGATTSGR